MIGAALWWGTVAVALSAARGVHGGFYVCPDACEALVLPRDMESIDDCLCASSSFRNEYQEEDEDAGVFECAGRYKPKEDVEEPRSVADCDCHLPYKKDQATGACHLRECPRAGNYKRKKSSRQGVTSLADCDCMAPFVKDPPSGECMPTQSDYECPPHSSPSMDQPQGDHQYPHHHRKPKTPRSFADCHCDWGFVRTSTGECQREKAAYACPVHSTRSPDLLPGEHPRGFFDCECDPNGYERNERMQACVKRVSPDDEDGDEYIVDEDFECPAFSRPLAIVPHSIEQCACLPGYAWKLPEMTCARASAYSCPTHAHFNPNRRGDGHSRLEAPAGFADCECARGYVRDEDRGQCLAWFLRDGNVCPSFAVLTRWPLQSSGNCECIYGFKNITTEQNTDEEDEEDEDEKKTPNKKECRSSLAADKEQSQMPLCPVRSFVVDWPVAQMTDDCACLFGYERAPRNKNGDADEDDDGYRCVQSESVDLDERAAKCRAPLVMNPLTGGCHYPIEDVKPSTSTVDYTLSTNENEDEVEDRNAIVLNGVEYDYVVADDSILVIQGDIAIGERLSWPIANNHGESSHVLLHGYYNAERDHRWRDATMCFQVDSSAKAMERVLLDAMKHITAVTGFNFMRCKGDDCSVVSTSDVGSDAATCAHDYINVKATRSSCFSYIGRIGGAQTLGVSTDCGLGNIMHVLLHAMGLRHAIDRPDRDQHVRIAWECIPEHKRSFFLVEKEESTTKSIAGDKGDDLPDAFTNEPYDFYSIMHHPTNAFVHDEDSAGRRRPKWCQSIVPLIGDPSERQAVMGLMGQRALLTVTDIHSVWRVYPSLHKGDAVPMPQVAASWNQPGRKSGLVVDLSKVHESMLHAEPSTGVSASALSTTSKKPSAMRSFVKRVTSFLGAVAVLCGFGAFMAFAVMEARKRALAMRGGGGGDAYYAELLLADKGGLND